MRRPFARTSALFRRHGRPKIRAASFARASAPEAPCARAGRVPRPRMAFAGMATFANMTLRPRKRESSGSSTCPTMPVKPVMPGRPSRPRPAPSISHATETHMTSSSREFERARQRIPRRGQLPRPRLPCGGRHTGLLPNARRVRCCSTSTRNATSTTSAPGARRSSAMPIPAWWRRCAKRRSAA